jgi:hypothetical protein
MRQSCVADLVNGATIDGGLRLVLSHLWASENVKGCDKPHPTNRKNQGAFSRPPSIG